MAIEAHKEEGIKEQGDPSSASLLAEVPPRDEVKVFQEAVKIIAEFLGGFCSFLSGLKMFS